MPSQTAIQTWSALSLLLWSLLLSLHPLLKRHRCFSLLMTAECIPPAQASSKSDRLVANCQRNVCLQIKCYLKLAISKWNWSKCAVSPSKWIVLWAKNSSHHPWFHSFSYMPQSIHHPIVQPRLKSNHFFHHLHHNLTRNIAMAQLVSPCFPLWPSIIYSPYSI